MLLVYVLCINDSYSQFYDVKIVRPIKEVSTRREPTSPNMPESLNLSEKNYKRSEKMNEKEGVQTADINDNVRDKKTAKNEKISVPLFCAPLDTLIVSSEYGYREDPFTGKRKFHAGTDYVTTSENVYAMMPGRIKKIGYDKKLGNFITIDHGELVVTYAHLHTVVGRKDDTVIAGQSIGLSGSTGRSTGEHLHIGMKYRKKTVNPDPIVRMIRDFANQVVQPIPLAENEGTE